uniref:Uncharacterized protein n=1 Tax=Myotis lucifugus TaxID=59463 RepID=G1Q3F8_MYOLU
MSHFTHWNASQVSKTLKRYDNVRVPHERKKENKKHEEPPEGLAQPHGQLLEKGEGVHIPEDRTEDTGGDQSTEEGPPSKTEARKDAKASPSSKAVGRSWQLSPPAAKNFQIHDRRPFSLPPKAVGCRPLRKVPVARPPQQGPFRDLLDMKTEKRLAGWKERRSRYGDINMHKCYQLGQVFTPFRALATMEMRRLVFPQHLPMSLHMRKMGISCTDERTLRDLPLSSTELGWGMDDNTHEKEKPAGHVRTPLFPPIVKAAKFKNMKKSKTKQNPPS